MDKRSRELMTSLVSNDYKRAVSDNLLTFNVENWQIFTENFFKLSPFETDRILEEITNHLDFHMVIDIISLADIIGKSIALSTALIKSFKEADVSPVKNGILLKIEELLDSSIAEERRIGMLLVGYFDFDQFVPKIFKMTDFDVLFEDAYFALALMTNPEITKKLSRKFLLLEGNHLQRYAIAKILARKGDSLATRWLFKVKDFEQNNSLFESTYISRELAWAGVRPAFFLDSDDEFLRNMSIKMIKAITRILPYDIDIVLEVDFATIIKKLLRLCEKEHTPYLVRIAQLLRLTFEELYYNINPFSVNKELREQIVSCWQMIEPFPSEKIINFVKPFIIANLNPKLDEFIDALRFIRILGLTDFEAILIAIAKENPLTSEQQFDLIGCLGEIGGKAAADFIQQQIIRRVDLRVRKSLAHRAIKKQIGSLPKNEEPLNENVDVVNQDDRPQQDQDSLFYWYSILSLGKIKSEESISVLLNALEDFDPKVRLEAVKGLRNISVCQPVVEEKLVSLAINDSFLSVRRESLLSLGELNSEAAIRIFIKIILEAIEDGTLEFTNEIIEDFDIRWEEEELNPLPTKQDTEEIDATHRIARTRTIASNENAVGNSFFHGMGPLDSLNQQSLELREDFSDLEFELPFASEDFDESLEFLPESDFIPDEEIEEEEQWLIELGERFEKITLVESAIEALKITQAKIPIEEIKELLAHSVDEELYKDALIILARIGEPFAIDELKAIFDSTDFVRAREIVETLWSIDRKELKNLYNEIKKSPDWVLKEIIDLDLALDKIE